MNIRNKMNSNMNTEGEIVKIKGLPRKKRKKIRNQNIRGISTRGNIQITEVQRKKLNWREENT